MRSTSLSPSKQQRKINSSRRNVVFLVLALAISLAFAYSRTSILVDVLTAPVATTNYYRLKMVDLDGKTAFSKVVSVAGTAADGKSLKVYPSVTKDFVTILTDLNTPDASGQVKGVSISDINGRQVRTVLDGRQNVNVQDLPNGVYFVRLLDKTRATGEAVRFVKQ